MGAASAGISVVSGIAGMVAKNKEAAAQAQAAADQRFQAHASSWAQQRTLQIQAETAQQQHSLGVLQSLSDYSMRETALKAQRQSAKFDAMQRGYGNDKQALETQTELVRQVGELNSAETQTLNQYQQQLGAADIKDTQLNDSIRQALAQAGQQASQQQKQTAMLDATRRAGGAAPTGDTRKQVLAGLAELLAMDQSQAASMLQNTNESDLATLSATLGLDNVDFTRDANSTNQLITADQQAFNTRDTARSLGNQQAALDAAQLNELTNFALTSQSNQRTYDANRSTNTVQQQAGIATANSVDASLKRAQDAPRGAGFLDVLNLGASAYNSFSPYFGTRSTAMPASNTTGGIPLRVVQPYTPLSTTPWR